MSDISNIKITLVVVNPEATHPRLGLYVNNRLTDEAQLYANAFVERIDSWFSLLQTYGWSGQYTCIEYNQINLETYFLSGFPPWVDELLPAPPNSYAKCVRSFGNENTIRESAWELTYIKSVPFI